jgi:chromosome segregation ATPase
MNDDLIKRLSSFDRMTIQADRDEAADTIEAQAKRIEKLERELHASKIVAECRMDELLVGGEVLALRERIADLDAQVRNCAQTADRRLTKIEKLEAANLRMLGEVGRADARVKELEGRLADAEALNESHRIARQFLQQEVNRIPELETALRKLLLIDDGSPVWDQEEWDAWDAAVEMAHSLTVEGLGK